MKKLKFCAAIALVATSFGCTSFNRDALWNAPISRGNYCTYWEEDFPVGCLFVHKQDDWTDKRLDYGYELQVVGMAGGYYLLDHGWKVWYPVQQQLDLRDPLDKDFSPSFLLECIEFLQTSPILVQVMDWTRMEEGSLFKEYGQYKFDGYKTVKLPKKLGGGEARLKVFHQINTDQTPVAKPYPFVYFRRKATPQPVVD